MKTSLLTVAFGFLITIIVSAQSESFMMLRDKFRGSENVFSFGTSGFVAKTILWAAGEREYKEVFRDVTNIRMMVIPRKAFRERDVTVKGFKKAAKKTEQFEEVLTFRDGGDDVSLLLHTNGKNKRNEYLLLVEDNSEVVAVEMVGYIDLQELRNSYEKSRTKNNNYYYNYRNNRSYNYRYKRS